VSNEQIWAPWRLAYIQSAKDDSQSAPRELPLLPNADPTCFLCRAAADPGNPQRHVVHCGPRTIVVLNRFPYNNGHLLVAPLRHCAKLDQLTREEHCDMAEGIARMVSALESTLRAEGFNVGLNLGRIAGAGLPGHLHWHIVPRWGGDTNFMPVLAGVNVIPQSLDALWEILTAELAQRDSQSAS
jgi:ATP adenylyltransferase